MEANDIARDETLLANDTSCLPISQKLDARLNMSLIMRKLAFCICENKDADQLRGNRNREADKPLCFRYIDSTILPLPKSEISSL